jgi:Peptidase A4 family
VKPGDVLHARVTQGTLELEDETAGWSATEEFPTAGLEFSSAEWIAEAPFSRFTDVGSVHFGGASASTAEASALEAGGSAFTITQPQAPQPLRSHFRAGTARTDDASRP